MSIIKQGVAALVILAVSGFAWLKLAPGSAETLARYGVDHPILTALASTPDAANDAAGGARGRFGGGATSVVVDTAGSAAINDRLNAIGNGQATQSVTVTPYTSGIVTEILVQSGDRLQPGDVIARLDAEEQRIAVERARLDLENAENTLQRRNTLRQQSSAAISGVEITEAELAAQTARLALREAELNLSRREINAPIAGVVGIIPATPGDYVTPSTEIVTIDDRSEILVDFWVPERFAGEIEVGMPVTAVPVASPDRVFEGEISAVDNRVDEASRTLRVRASVPNEDDRLRAGMSFSVTMTFDGDVYPAVDPLAVQWSADGPFVWRASEDKAERVPVRIVQRNSDSVLVEADIAEGDAVIIEGLAQLRDGSDISVVGKDGADNGEAPVARNDDAPSGRS